MHNKTVREFYKKFYKEMIYNNMKNEILVIADDKGHTYDVEYIKKNDKEGMVIRLNRK